MCIIGVFSTSCTQLQSLITPSNLETISALRQVLNSSSVRALQKLNNFNNGGVAGLLPDEIRPVLNTLKTLGLGSEVGQVTSAIENASAVVAKESALIMKDAISDVSFGDAASVVLGGSDAATGVLKQKMYSSVKKRYSTRMENELGKTDALKYWPMAAGAYNLFSKNKVDSSLSDFLAERAVDAAFLGMGVEEKAIRTDYKSLGSAVVTKVFDYYGSQKR